MSIENLFQKYVRKSENFIDKLTYGEDEDKWVRYARRKEFREKYGNLFIVAWTPGLYAYCDIKDHFRNSKLTRKQKAISFAAAIGYELILDTARIGSIYLIYKFTKYLFF